MLAGGETVLVAVSGGADSVALLHLLLDLSTAWRLRLHVLHVDHQLRAESAADADFVRDLGARLGVPVDVATVAVDRRGSLEASARAARYAALEACAARVGAERIAVGHTADDQAETVLMRLVQGAATRLGRVCRIRSTGGASDANVFAARGLEIANLRCGMREIHTVNEWVDLKDVRLTAALVVEAVRLNAAA